MEYLRSLAGYHLDCDENELRHHFGVVAGVGKKIIQKKNTSLAFQGGMDKRKERETSKQNYSENDLQNDKLESDIRYTATPLARNHIKRSKFRGFLKTQRSLEGNSAVGANSDKLKSL